MMTETIIDGGETVDRSSGEVLDRVAADGRRKVPAASSFAEFVKMLEDGQVDADLHAEMQRIANALTDYHQMARSKAKGQIKITIDFAFDGIFRIDTKWDTKLPKEERMGSVLFASDDNRFTPHRPGQGDFFGMRDVNGPATFRDA